MLGGPVEYGEGKEWTGINPNKVRLPIIGSTALMPQADYELGVHESPTELPDWPLLESRRVRRTFRSLSWLGKRQRRAG